MRVNLNVPYAEKDRAKRLGARWDPALRVWYVVDMQNLFPFLKWMPSHLKKPVNTEKKTVKNYSKPTSKPDKKVTAKKQCNRLRKVSKRTDFSIRSTGCSCVPWEWCEHNPKPENPPAAFVYKPQIYAEALEAENLEHIRSIINE